MTSDGMLIRLNRLSHTGAWRSVLAVLFITVALAAMCLPAIADPLLTIVSVPAAGGTTTGAGTYTAGAPVTLTATPNTGYVFVGWSTDAAGANTFTAYNYKMPATDTTLYAQFSSGANMFSDDFESTGDGVFLSTVAGSWWKDDYPNGCTANNILASSNLWSIPQLPGSTRFATGRLAGDWDSDAINLAYHCGNGANLTGNFMVNWMYYDPIGSTGTPANYTDNVALGNVSIANMATTELVPGTYAWLQRIAVAAGGTGTPDLTKYQVRCIGYTDGYSAGNWFNTTKPRSIGWHEGTIRVGAPETNGSNLITILIDGQQVFSRNSTTTTGYNLLELNSCYSSAPGAFDNVRVISTQLPSVTNLVATASATQAKTINATWATANADHSLVQVDNGPWQDPATSPATLTVASIGTHTVNVKAVNAAGQVSPTVSLSVLVDLPISGLAVSPSPVTPGTPTVASWSCAFPADHFMVQIDGGAWSQQASPYTIDTTGMVLGNHTITVKGIDAGGSEGTASSATFTVDRSILTWNIIGQYPWQGYVKNADGSVTNGVAAGSTRFATNMFDPVITEDKVGAKTGFSYASTVQPTVGISKDGVTPVSGTCNTSWAPYTSATPSLDLNAVYSSPAATGNTEYGVTYLCTYVYNNSGAPITNMYFACGSDDGNKVWINGVAQTLVSSLTETADTGTVGHDVYRGVRLNDDLYGPFTLKTGGNKILCKLTQGSTGYGFQGQLCDSTRHEHPAVTAGNISYGVSDDTPPTGSVVINGGAATAQSFNVTLALTAADELNPVTKMALSNDGYTFSDPVAFAPTASWVLSDGPGSKTVYAKLIDSCGNEAIVTDDIIVPNGWTVMTINCDTTAGNPSGAGVYSNGASVTVSANPFAGYSFIGWSDANTGCLPPGQTTPVISTNPNYQFTIHSDMFLFANYKANTYTMTATACANGTTTGSGSYTTASSVTVTATPDTNYRFTKWTSDSCGGTAVVSTNSTYTFNMPPNNYTLYANFEYVPQLTIVAVPAAGGTAGTSGRYNKGSSVALLAAANAGYVFAGWSTDQGGLSIVTPCAAFSYTMPAGDTTLYAQFIPSTTINFFEDFENKNVSPTLLAGQGWWCNDFPNGNGVNNNAVWTSYSPVTNLLGSTKFVAGRTTTTADMDNVLVNLAYHVGNGANLPGNFIVDWWFYDAAGTNSTNAPNWKDYFALSCVGGMPMNGEPTSGTAQYTWAQRICVGSTTTTGYDKTKYQIRCFGVTGGLSGGTWLNSPISRAIGWHNGRIYVGPQTSPCHNLIDIYIDNKLAWEGDSNNSNSISGYNFIECLNSYGTQHSAYDNIRITDNTMPYVSGFSVTPTTVILDTTPVTVNWTANNADHSEIQIDNGGWVTATSPYSINTTSVYGTHTVYVRCLDAAGQSSPVLSASYTVDHNSIRTWATIGSYAKSGTTPIDTEYFAPTATDATVCAKVGYTINGNAWRSYTAPGRSVDFDLVYGGNHTNCVSYVFNYVINSGAAIPNAYLACGSDDGNMAYVNGVQVMRNDVAGGVTPDQYLSSAFTLNPGLNRLLIKETQGTGGEGVQARFTDATKGFPAWLSQLTYVQSDDTAPTGTIQINGGAATTNTTAVTLTLAANDVVSPAGVATGIKSMQFSNDNVTYGAPVAFATSAPYTLTTGDGAKTVYVEFIDGAGNVSAPISATITLSTGPQAPPACTEKVKISDLWPLANDATVYGLDSVSPNTNAKTVTAVWSDGFWIEETNRYAGIKVVVTGGTYKYFDDATKSAIQPGDVVDVYGNLSVTTGNDRVFNASYVRDRTAGAGTAIPALGVTQRYIVGKQASANTPGLPSGKGIYSAGLFVKLAGAVLNPAADNFFLDDKTYLPGTGIQVFCGTLSVPTSGNKVVTGVVGMVGNVPVIYATSIQ